MRRLLTVLATAAIIVLTMAMPALAQGALVNIEIEDVLTGNDIIVAVPIGVAANVCGVQANVIAQNNQQDPIDCTARTTQDLPIRFRG